MSDEPAKKPRKPRTRLSRLIPGAKIQYRGKLRPVIAEIDTAAGTFAVRLHGCRTRKSYQIEDLFNWGPQLTLL